MTYTGQGWPAYLSHRSRPRASPHLCCWVLNFQLPEDGSTVVGNGDVADVVHQHLSSQGKSSGTSKVRANSIESDAHMILMDTAATTHRAYLVQAYWAQRRLDNVCNGSDCHDILGAHVLSTDSLSLYLKPRSPLVSWRLHRL